MLDWVDIILIWVVVSALVTPLVGRMLGRRFTDPVEDESLSAMSVARRHETVES